MTAVYTALQSASAGDEAGGLDVCCRLKLQRIRVYGQERSEKAWQAFITGTASRF